MVRAVLHKSLSGRGEGPASSGEKKADPPPSTTDKISLSRRVGGRGRGGSRSWGGGQLADGWVRVEIGHKRAQAEGRRDHKGMFQKGGVTPEVDMGVGYPLLHVVCQSDKSKMRPSADGIKINGGQQNTKASGNQMGQVQANGPGVSRREAKQLCCCCPRDLGTSGRGNCRGVQGRTNRRGRGDTSPPLFNAPVTYKTWGKKRKYIKISFQKNEFPAGWGGG